ncbi:MAG TPA: M48 family metallopeptidase [Solirubrobacteraceae bacterium]|jgi:Zn-dependent protease with chaperone function
MRDSSSPSLLGRALLALALTVVFYVLAIAMAAALIGLPVGRVASGHGFPIFIGIAMVIAGISILVSIVPRRDKFVAPGPRLSAEQQPELFAAVEGVAKEVGHPMPEEVYLAPDVNAAVTEVGPLLWRKRRVLILGLPLLELLTVEQLRAVIAHEFGHYVGGDTRVGRWTYRTRRAIVRTVESLRWDEDDDGWFERLVRAPFEGYAKLFLRITAAISRKQEFAADALAVKVAGRDAHVGALRAVAAGAPAFDHYWGTEVIPALTKGVRPPLGEGFRRYLSVEAIDRAVEHELNTALEEDQHDPYDSHPTLRQRLEAVGAKADEHVEEPGERAVTLVRDHATLENDLLHALYTVEGGLEPGSWEEVDRRRLEGYEQLAGELGSLLDGKSVRDLPDLVRDLGNLALRLRRERDDIPTEDDAKGLVFDLLGATTVLALVRNGFTFSAGPGQPIACTRGEERFEPFDELGRLLARDTTDEDRESLRARLGEAGVADEALAPAKPAATAAG